MSYTIAEVKENLTAMGHGGTLNKVRSFESACERAANTMIAKVKLLEMIRREALSQNVHDNIFEYSLPTDYLSIIDIYPQSERTGYDKASRGYSEKFDLKKMLTNKQIVIEGRDGEKKLRINWKTRSPKTLNTMDSYNGNGTWIAYNTASNITSDTIVKYSGSGSVRFDTTGFSDGISNTTMDSIDLTDEDEVADVIFPIYLSSVEDLVGINIQWGNDLTTNYWTGVGQTAQADGTALRVGWNLIKVPWSTATETGTVDPSAINSFRIVVTLDPFGTDLERKNIRVDNIQFAIGYPFEIKYYSKYLFKNSSGTYISKPTSDDDVVICDSDSIQIFLLELLKVIAHQLEGSDSAFDISFAENELKVLYAPYKAENPNQTKKARTSYFGLPRFRK